MSLFSKIAAILCLPLALLMLVTGFSPVTALKQTALEERVEELSVEEFEPVFRFVACSDIHINAGAPARNERLRMLFETAYAYADAHPTYNKLDAVVMAGDITDSGSNEEYAILKSYIDNNMREGTELVSVMGNHDLHGDGRDGYLSYIDDELDKHVVVNGFHFIGMSPEPEDVWHTPSQLIWMDRELRRAEADDPERPIFTFQHGHIWNTVYVSRSWFTQMFLPLHLVYAKYPQVINFSGHSHGPINNPIDIWQNSYTALGTGTLNYFEMERDIGDDTVPEGSGNAAQYLVVEVDAQNRVRVMPFNILTNDFFKTPATTDDPDKQLVYFIEAPSKPVTYAYTSARKKTAGTPWFSESAGVTVSDITGESVKVTFDRADDDVCVYGYRITVTEKGKLFKTAEKEVYGEYYFEPLPDTQSCVIDGLDAGKEYTVTVTAMNVWLKTGGSISATFKTEN
ncbi:MAG: metallophosphoesterase [Clostridia bacterium]|nr:metallophosphoesterase [Clostridia bacterium]